MLNKKLMLLEEELKEIEGLSKPVQVIWHKILLANGYDAESAWHEFGAMCASHPWFEESKNPYHNAVHTAQVMWCGHVLAPEVMIEMDKRWFPKFILALMYHDVGHNGKNNTYQYQLELVAGRMFESFLFENPQLMNLWMHYLEVDNGDWKEMIEFVKRIILGTEVTIDVPKNIKTYEESQKHTLLEVLLVLAQEADVLPSALPNVGVENGKKLAEEWVNPSVATNKGRLYFLNMIKYVSKSANKLGIQEMINEQKKLLELEINQ